MGTPGAPGTHGNEGTAWRGAALVRIEPAHEIRCVTSATSNRVKQAAPGNDSAYGFFLALLLTKAFDSRFADELQRAG